MTSMISLPDENMRHHRLLGGWRDVLDDIRALCRTFEGLPDMCQCGHGEPHLAGTCACCGQPAGPYVPSCDDCERDLARVRPAIDLLTVDKFRFFPFVKEFLASHDASAAARARDTDTQIAALVHSFEMLVLAEGRFRSACRDSHLKELKDTAATLRREAESLNRMV